MKRLTREQVELIESRLAAGETHVGIARTTGTSAATVRDIAHGKHYHQQTAEEQARRRNSTLGSYLPSAEEIAAHCERFLRLAPRRPVGYMPFQWHGPLFPG